MPHCEGPAGELRAVVRRVHRGAFEGGVAEPAARRARQRVAQTLRGRLPAAGARLHRSRHDAAARVQDHADPTRREVLRLDEPGHRRRLDDRGKHVGDSPVLHDGHAHRVVPALRYRSHGQIADHRLSRVQRALETRLRSLDRRQRRAGRREQIDQPPAVRPGDVDVAPVGVGRQHALGHGAESRQVAGGQALRLAQHLDRGDRPAQLGVDGREQRERALLRSAAEGVALLLNQKVADGPREDGNRQQRRQDEQRQVSSEPHRVCLGIPARGVDR